MRDELGDLAARVRAAVDAVDTAQDADQRARHERLAVGRAARAELVEELVGFGRALGVEVLRDGDLVSWLHDDRPVIFELMGDGDRIKVSWRERRDREGRLYREQALADRWVLQIHGIRHDDRIPLIEQGLVRLITKGLGLPAPDGADGHSDGSRKTRAAPPAPSGTQGPSDPGTPPDADPAPQRKRTL